MATGYVDGGTQTATVTTEHTLKTVSAAGIYVLLIDFSNMTGSDRTEIRCKTRVLDAGTTRTTYLGTLGPDGDEQIVQTTPLVVCGSSTQEGIFTLKQTAGSSRDYYWKVILIAEF